MFPIRMILALGLLGGGVLHAQELGDIQNMYQVHKTLVETKDDATVYGRTNAGEGALNVFQLSARDDYNVSEEGAGTVALDSLTLSEEIDRESDFEQATRDWESELLFRMQMRTLFSNERIDDSVFDLVQDLNDIDVVLFGTKAEPVLSPPFAQKTSTEFEESIHELSQIGDKGQERIFEGLEVDVEKSDVNFLYDEGASSLAGVWDQSNRFLYELEGKTLATGCLGNRIFEMSILCQNFPDFTTNQVWTIPVPPPFKFIPEVYRVTRALPEAIQAVRPLDIFPFFNALEVRILEQSSCSREFESGGEANVDIKNENIDACLNLEADLLERDIQAIKTRSRIMMETQNQYRGSYTLEQFGLMLKSLQARIELTETFMRTIADKNIVTQ